jgi:hypothetical protein
LFEVANRMVNITNKKVMLSHKRRPNVRIIRSV